jgi:hypothetical protein
MTKQLPVPQINSLQELLEILTNAEKYAKLVIELAELQDSITQSLGVYAQGEEIDRRLSEVEYKEQNLKVVEADQFKLFQECTDELDERAEELSKTASILSETQAKQLAVEDDLKKRERKLAQDQAKHDERVKKFNDGVKTENESLTKRSDFLRKREKDLKARLRKLKELAG